MRLFIFLSVLFGWVVPVGAQGVVATIKPIHALVSGVMGETGEAVLLLRGANSPHHFELKPSQMRGLQRADVIFYVDDELEVFLRGAFRTLSARTKRVALARQRGIKLLSRRARSDPHDDHDDHDHHHHDHGDEDMHIWLGPENARQMVKQIAEKLSEVYPQHRAAYAANARRLIKKIDDLDKELKTRLSAVRGKPFIVLHDAYQYFERAYGLKSVGSIMSVSANLPSPRRIKEARARLRRLNVGCVLREPQFSDRFIQAVIEGSSVKIGVLDPLGARLAAGEDMYFTLLRDLAENLERCLK